MMTTATCKALCDLLAANNSSFTQCAIGSLYEYDEMMQISGALKRNTTLEKVTLWFASQQENLVLSAPLAVALMDHPKLKKIVFYGLSSEEFSPFAIAFQKNERLSSLVLQECHVTKSTALHLSFLLKENALISLKFISCQEGPWNLFGALASNHSLKKLVFYDTTFELETLRDIARFILRNQTNLETLCLDRTLFNDCGSDRKLMQHCLVSAARCHKSLRRFTFRNDLNTLNEVILEEIANVAATAPMLRSLHLTQCNMRQKEIGLLLKGLSDKISRVEELDLHVIIPGEDPANAATALADFLRNDCKLKILHLYGNYFGDHEAYLLASALEKNRCLESLCLDGNEEIGPSGASHFAKALATNTSLKSLYLDDINVEGESLAAFFEMLKSNTTLERLRIGGNMHVQEAQVKTLVESLPHLKGLKHLELFWFHNADVSSKVINDVTGVLERDNTVLERLEFMPSMRVDRTRLDYLLSLNSGGRRILEANNVPDALWSIIFARSLHSPREEYVVSSREGHHHYG